MKKQTPRDQSIAIALRAYIHQIWKYKAWTIPALLLPGIGMVFTMYIPPLVIARIITDFNGKLPNTFEEILPYIIVLAGAWLFGEVIWRIAFLFLNRADIRGIKSLYIEALDQLLEKDIDFFNNNFAGSLTKKAIGYGRNFEGFMDTLAFRVVGNILPLGFAVVVLWTISPVLVLVLLVMITVVIAAILPLIKKRQKLVKIREAASNKMAGHVADVIGNIAAVQSFGHEIHEKKRHRWFVEDLGKATIKTWDYHVLRVDTIIAPAYVFANVLGLIVALLVTDNAATMAAVFVSFSYFIQSTRVLFEFNQTYRQLEMAITESAQFTELILQPTVLQASSTHKKLKVSKGEIVFDSVTFGYGPSDKDALFKNLNLTIKSGEKVAFVGHSGGGKTTITKLLLRFVDIQSGHLQIDGQDINSVSLNSLRQAIAYVPQDPAMFHRSIMENIRYGRLGASDDEVLDAANKAHAVEFIEKLSEGYETLVGERGVKLSGGQRQRIAIARAIVKNAPILILDEATSALDSESEVLIQDALWKLMEKRTTIVIAHRLSTIQKMDRIIVLDHGSIIEQGTHKQLLGQNGTYARLWAHQSGGFIEE